MIKRLTKAKPELARAWVVTVINPILDGLRREQNLLDQKNWSWRYITGRFEHIAPIIDYIDVRYHDNHEEFCHQYPEIARLISKHDQALDDLAKALSQAYGRLLEMEELRRELERIREECTDYQGLWRDIEESEHIKIIAEHMLNTTPSLSQIYMDYRFWNKFRDRFINLRIHPGIKGHIDKIERQGLRVARAAADLMERLKALRSEYARKFGIPPVPPSESFGSRPVR